MSIPLTVECEVHFRHQRGRPGATPRPQQDAPVGRVPRISRLMALAIRFDEYLRTGAVAGQWELAELGHVTTARISQIMNLLNLAPEIQEQILFLQHTLQGRDALIMAELQPIASEPDWGKQRRRWRELAKASR